MTLLLDKRLSGFTCNNNNKGQCKERSGMKWSEQDVLYVGFVLHKCRKMHLQKDTF